jgi:hypothetical protein
MTTYKGIKGSKVKSLASDPEASESVGTVWYNTAGYVFKYSLEGTAAWASGGNFPSIGEVGPGFGTQTAAVYGVVNAGPAGYTTTTFEYNGTSWSGPASVNRNGGGSAASMGTQTAGQITGGYNAPGNAAQAVNESYNGSTWTEVADINTARQYARGTGSSTAAIVFGGTTAVGPTSSQTGLDVTETWDGSTWTEVGDLNTARSNSQSLGTTNAAPTAVIAGGHSGGTDYAVVESWNGTSWTEIADLNSDHKKGGGAGTTNTAGIVFAGGPPSIALTESWNGTAWTEVADLAAGRRSPGGTGSSTSALCMCGFGTTAQLATVEEWSDPVLSIKTVTVS